MTLLRGFYLDTSFFASDYHDPTLHAPSLPSIRIHYTDRYFHHHFKSSRRGFLGRRGGTWQERWFNNRSSDHEGVLTWSVLVLVVVVYSHTFNRSDPYPLDPRQRLHRHRQKGPRSSIYQSLFHRDPPQSPVAALSNIHSAVPELTRERRAGKSRRAACTPLAGE